MLLRGARGLAGGCRGVAAGGTQGRGRRGGAEGRVPVPHPTVTDLRDLSDTPAKADGTSGTGSGTDTPRGEGGLPRPPRSHPTHHCCGTGCRCVWVGYVEELLERCGDGGAQAMAAVEEHVEDENIKMILRMEIRLRGEGLSPPVPKNRRVTPPLRLCSRLGGGIWTQFI
ncbi:LOW QUALITY PROTEIN: oxidoreductase-like domain-containing protein 1 [Pterocles gutturalis]